MPKPPKRPTDEAVKAKVLSRWEGEGGAPPPEKHKPKRPRDLNKWAKRIVDVATGETPDQSAPDAKNPQAAAAGRLGGRKGGKARAEALSSEQRSLSARRAARARWAKKN